MTRMCIFINYSAIDRILEEHVDTLFTQLASNSAM